MQLDTLKLRQLLQAKQITFLRCLTSCFALAKLETSSSKTWLVSCAITVLMFATFCSFSLTLWLLFLDRVFPYIELIVFLPCFWIECQLFTDAFWTFCSRQGLARLSSRLSQPQQPRKSARWEEKKKSAASQFSVSRGAAEKQPQE